MPEPPFVLETGPMSAETKKIAESELNETPERVEESVAELRRLLHENTDLYYQDDEATLKLFLRPCHFYPESAIKLVSTDFSFEQNKIDRFFSVERKRNSYRKIFMKSMHSSYS